jgi:Na+/H+ antiporter NhaD/arsenite permease-like protein
VRLVHIAAAVFALTYILVSAGENSPRKLDRPTASLLGAVLMVVTGALTRAHAAAAIDFSTLALLFGMMVLLAVLTQSGLPAHLTLRALGRCRSPHSLLGLVVLSSGIGSAIMLNDTVCLLGTPLVLQVTRQAGVPPLPFLLALATSANMGSVMTLTGNPQNMLIGHASGWGWSPFALRMAPIGLACLAVNYWLLTRLYRDALQTAGEEWQPPHPIASPFHRRLAYKSTCTFLGLIAALLFGAPMDFAAVSAATVLLVWANRPPKEALQAVDWSLLLFFAGLFVVVEGFVREERYLLDRSLHLLGHQVDWASVCRLSVLTILGSNLFSNVPYVLIVSHWVRQMSDPRFIWLLLALTSTFAGNLTLFGSVANMIVAQGAQEQAPIRFGEFLRVGVPVTLVTIALGVLLLWLMRG